MLPPTSSISDGHSVNLGFKFKFPPPSSELSPPVAVGKEDRTISFRAEYPNLPNLHPGKVLQALVDTRLEQI